MDLIHVSWGHNVDVTISFSNAMPVGSFNLLISYDPSLPQFLYAEPIGVMADWEYFSYQYSRTDTCGGDCPVALIRLAGIADLPDGEDPGDVFHPEGEIIRLVFNIPEICWYAGQCRLLQWTWFGCGDNSFVSSDGDSTFLAADIDTILPGGDCLSPVEQGEIHPRLHFEDGFICLRLFCENGDMNLDGRPYDIGDAVLFANYFIYGPIVLHDEQPPDWYENRALASDYNDDGQILTLADLVCLLCIISTGETWSYCVWNSKLTPLANMADVNYTTDEEMVVSTKSPVDMGAAAFEFRHTGVEVGTPVLSDEADKMTIGFSDQNGVLRVLVYSMDGNSIDAGEFNLFTVPVSGDGTIELVEVQLSDAWGNVLTPNTARITPPMTYELLQNYPNPFNASTAIGFALPMASGWSLRIYDIVGRLVDEFAGFSPAGQVSIQWDATDAASGIYFYKLSAGDFTNTKKMVLMK